MKRWLLAIPVLLGGSVGFASADYIVIVANLGQIKEVRTQSDGSGGGPGYPGGGGPGYPGGIGGVGGNIGGRGGIGGMPSGGGLGGRGGVGGGIGGRGGPGMPNGGGLTGGPGFPGGGNPPAPPPEDVVVDPDAVPLYVTVILEIRDLDATAMQYFKSDKVGKTYIHHKWGESVLLAALDDDRLQYRSAVIRRTNGTPIPGVFKRYEEEYKDTFNGKSTPDVERVLLLAQWALEHGMVDKFTEVMDGLAKDHKDNNIVATYLTVKANLANALKDPASTPVQTSLEDKFKLKRVFSEHYYVVDHQAPSDNAREVQSRLTQLENNFKSFYYTWALKGISLPLPAERLTTVLTGNPTAFKDLHHVLTSSPIVADGFYARRENLAVMSAERQDDGYEALKGAANPRWVEGFDRNKILIKPGMGVPAGTQPQGQEAQTAAAMALLLKALDQDSERSSTSHDGTRQLIYGAGLLPKNVASPEWIQFGMGSFFETPLGSPWMSTGAPNMEQLPNFRDYEKLKRFEKTPGETLRKVITDSYFRDAAARKDVAAEYLAVERKARASAWALTYFLMKTRPDSVLRYYRELSKLPRDVELDDETLLACFARAFGLVDSGKNVDARKFDELGTDWFKLMKHERLDLEDDMTKIRHFITSVTKEKPKDAPPAGGGPGVGPGAGGPGFGPGAPAGGPSGPRQGGAGGAGPGAAGGGPGAPGSPPGFGKPGG